MSNSWAAIGTDGTRPVVWGLGDSEEEAVKDACHWLESDASSLVTREITAAQRAAVIRGDVAISTLGIELTPSELRALIK